MFNSPSSGADGAGGGSTGSGFDLLNPFSWLDEVTKPRPPLHQHQRPGSSSSFGSNERPYLPASQTGLTGGGAGSHAGRPAGRPSGPTESDYNENPGLGGNDEPLRQPHESHHHGHRPYRPSSGGTGRDTYDDHHHEHEHDHHHDHHHDCDHDYDQHNQNRPHRPIRPQLGNDYDTYPGRRPDRPYSRRDEGALGSPLSRSSVGERDEPSSRKHEPVDPTSDSSPSRPASGLGAGPVSSYAPILRVPGSVLSPFGSLFGSLDDSLFGGLRSSFIDAPLKAAVAATADTVRQLHGAALDTIVTSPKISLPPASPTGPNPIAAAADTQASRPASSPDSAQSSRLISVDSGEPSAVRRQPASESGSLDSGKLQAGGSPSAASASLDKQKVQQDTQALPARSEFARSGMGHFLLMI